MSVICSGDRTPFLLERGIRWEEEDEEEEGGFIEGEVEDRGVSAEEKRDGRVGLEEEEGEEGGRMAIARQESDSPLIGSIGHCQRRIFSCSLTGRAVRMIAHLSAQKTNKNKPLLI